MGDKSAIEWTDATWNPIVGCAVVSPGCTNCYAMRVAGRMEAISIAHEAAHGGDPGPMERYRGTTAETRHGKAVWTGKVRFVPEVLTAPLRWKRPRMIFVNSMSDLFAEGVEDEWIDQIFAVMALCGSSAPRSGEDANRLGGPGHTFQVLTKRPERMRRYLADPDTPRRVYELVCDMVVDGDADGVLIAPGIDPNFAPPGRRIFLGVWPLPNVWLGTSVEDQARADERIPHLLATPAAVRFVSAEPLLGPVDLEHVETDDGFIDALAGYIYSDADAVGNIAVDGETGKLDWVIVGGESGPGARPMHPDWARGLRDQCAAAGVPYFLKQWGEWTPGENVERVRGVVETATWFGDRWRFDRENLAREDGHIDDEPELYRVGKKAAGRVLDGVTHDAMPARVAAPSTAVPAVPLPRVAGEERGVAR